MLSQLDFKPRTKGRAKRALSCEIVREIGEVDLAALDASRNSVSSGATIIELRDRHHALARCLAEGMKDAEASAITGYSGSRISILKSAPAFKELVAFYKSQGESQRADFVERATQVALTAADLILDKMENAGDDISMDTLRVIAKDFSDRAGFAPVQKSVSVNANINLGEKLKRARERANEVTVLELTAKEVP